MAHRKMKRYREGDRFRKRGHQCRVVDFPEDQMRFPVKSKNKEKEKHET